MPQISHYQTQEEIGRGGMGIVYRALDTRLGRLAALKLLPPDAAGDPERIRRFVQEARAASALNHPNIVTIYDVGEDAGTTFIAMELVSGTPLDRLLRDGRVTGRTGARLRHPGRIGARGRARPRHHPPRHQASEHHDHVGWSRQGA